MQRAGWDPFDPSRECAAAVARHRTLGQFDWVDAACMQLFLLDLKISSRFCRNEPAFVSVERGKFVWSVALLFLMVEIRHPSDWTLKETQALDRMFDRWWKKTYEPTRDRFDQDTTKFGPDYVADRFTNYQPVVTLMALQEELGIADIEGDRRRISRAYAMLDQGEDDPKDVALLDLSALMALHRLATADGRCVSRWDSEGRLVLDVGRVKRGLEVNVMRARVGDREKPLTVVVKPHLPLPEAADTSASPADEALQTNLLDAVRAIVTLRGAEAVRSPAMRAAATHFDALVMEDESAERVGDQAGVSPQAIRQALRELLNDPAVKALAEGRVRARSA